MTSSVLPDQTARDAITGEVHKPLFVEAGAGSGKTRELVHRVINLVVSGECAIQNMAVITFTNAAASELRERIRMAADAALRKSTLRDEQRLLRECLNKLDSASIETIHGFAHRLIKDSAAEAGLPPVFELVDHSTSYMNRRAAYQRLVTSTLSSPDALDPILAQALRVGIVMDIKTSQLWDLMQSFFEAWDRIPDAAAFAPLEPVDLQPIIDAAKAAVAHSGFCKDASDKLLVHLEGPLSEWISRLETARTAPAHEQLDILRTYKRAGTNAGTAPAWGDTKKQCQESLTAMMDLRGQAIARLCSWSAHVIASTVAQHVRSEVSARLSRGELEFHDLLVLARNVVRDNTAVRNRIQSQYRHLLVDEFQDTDPLQAELVSMLGSSLFTVGDPRQSIYRFRGADVAQYRKMKPQHDGLAELVCNFRTTPALVGLVSQVTGGLAGVVDEGDSAEVGARRVSAIEGSVTVVGKEYPKERKAAEIRELEATDVVGRIRDMVGNATAIEDEGVIRSMRYNDVAILLPTRTALPAIERELQNTSVPYRIESRAMIWSTQEIRDVMTVLGAIDDPSDPIALVGALKSTAFAHSDTELYEWKTNGGSWDYRQAVPPALSSAALAGTYAWFATRHRQRGTHGVAQLIEEVIDDCALRVTAFGNPRHRESWHRLSFLCEVTKDWEMRGGVSLGEFVRWARNEARNDVDVREAPVAETDDDAVRIMTIHASKGLEFPVVALAGLGSVQNNTASGRALWHEGSWHIRLGKQDLGFESSGFADAAEVDKAAEAAEGARLLYVGLTRARDHLVMSIHRGHSDRTLASRLAKALDGVAIPETHVETVADVPIAGAAPRPASADAKARRNALLDRGSRRRWASATAINRLLVGEVEFDRSMNKHFAPEERQVRMSIGNSVHNVLEVIDLDGSGDDEVRRLCAWAADVNGVVDHLDRIVRSVQLALGSTYVSEAMTSGRYWREVFGFSGEVAGEKDRLTIEGVIDLCYERDGGLVVVDYKTEDASDDAGATYEAQLTTYARILEQTTGLRVIEAVLLFVGADNPEAVAWSISDLDAKIAQLPEKLGDVAKVS